MAVAYSLTDFQVFSEMKWFESQRYDLEAKASGPADLTRLRLMLRSLLNDRFQLKFHKEDRDMNVYGLRRVKPDAAAGPGLVKTPDGDCSASVGDQAALANGTSCGVVNLMQWKILGQRGHISQLCDRLTTLLGRVLVDQTGLAGNFNISVIWIPDPELERGGAAGPLYGSSGAAWLETGRHQGAGRIPGGGFGGSERGELRRGSNAPLPLA